MLVGMLSILVTWSLAVLAFCGWGLAIERLLGLRHHHSHSILSSFWLGWSFGICVLQIWHVFSPITWKTSATLLTLGLACCIPHYSRIALRVRQIVLRSPVFCLVLLGFLIWLSYRAMGPIQPYDAGLYHLSAVRWVASYPLIPGLGNLHGRLAFNSSYFLFLALLDVGPWQHMSHHIASGLLLSITALETGVSVSRVITSRSTIQAHDMLRVMLVAPILRQCWGHAASTSSDLPVFMLGIAISVQLCKILFPGNRDHDTVYDTFLTIVLSAIGISIKLSFLVLGVAASLVAIGKLLPAKWDSLRQHWRRKLALFVLPAAVVVLPWLFRGVVLSGYLAYPSTYGAFNVDWRVPEERVVSQAKWIRSWARQPRTPPDEVLANWDWFVPWFKRISMSRGSSFDVVLPLVLALGSMLVLSCFKETRSRYLSICMLFLLPPAAALVFWFFAAPAPRLGGAAFWYLGAGAGSIAFAGTKRPLSKHSRAIRAIVLFPFLLAMLVVLLKIGFVETGPQNGFHPVPSAKVHTFVTKYGLTVYVPDEGDQCWDAPLPCSPYPNPKLRLRHSGEMNSGFTVYNDRH